MVYIEINSIGAAHPEEQKELLSSVIINNKLLYILTIICQ